MNQVVQTDAGVTLLSNESDIDRASRALKAMSHHYA